MNEIRVDDGSVDYVEDYSSVTCDSIHSESNGSNNDNDEEQSMALKYAIVQSIFKALNLNKDSGESLNNFDALLSLARDMYCLGKGVNEDDPIIKDMWPKTWDKARKYLVELGYVDAKEYFIYFICLNNSHSRHWDIMDSHHEVCRHCQNPGDIKYYYLGLEGKVKQWYSNPDMCEKMSAHWNHKDRWLDRVNEHTDHVKKEFWDGDRFSELSWFWNPQKKWLLPARCKTPQCNNVLSPSYIEEQPLNVDGGKEVYCDQCCSIFMHQPEYSKGDPRNIAYIGNS